MTLFAMCASPERSKEVYGFHGRCEKARKGQDVLAETQIVKVNWSRRERYVHALIVGFVVKSLFRIVAVVDARLLLEHDDTDAAARLELDAKE